MKRIAILLLTGCVPEARTPTRGEIEAQMRPPPAPSRPDCSPIVPVDLLQPASGTVPVGVTQEDAIRAAAKFINRVGITVAKLDAATGTIVTERFVGQTLEDRCRPINEYRSYVAHVTITGASLDVTLDCLGSVGWEAHMQAGVWFEARRDHLGPCSIVSAQDAKIPRMIVDGTLSTLQLQQLSAPPTLDRM